MALLVFLPNVSDFYVSDDYDHPYVTGLGWQELSSHLTEESGPGVFFRPLSLLSMGLDHLLWGRTPVLSHLMAMLLHGISALLVAAITRRLSESPQAGIVAGVLFAAHPVHPEAVAFLGSRFDLLATVLGLGALASYLRFSHEGRIRWLSTASGLALGSLLAKESGVFVPIAILVYEAFGITRRRWWGPLPVLGVAALYAAYRVGVIGAVSGYGHVSHVPVLALRYWSETIRFSAFGLLTPASRAVFGEQALVLSSLLGALLLVPVAFVVRRPRPLRPILFALVVTLLALAPPSPLMNSAGLVDRLEGSRFLYFPSAAFSVLLGLAISRIEPGKLRWWLFGVQATAYATLTLAHAMPWHHAAMLARRTLDDIGAKCPGPTVLVANPPDNYKGAHLWRNGLVPAVRQFHPTHAEAYFLRPSLPPEFENSEAFDVRDWAGKDGVCLLAWNPETERVDDRTAELRRATPVRAAPVELGWDAWKVQNGAARVEGSTWVLETESDDLHIEAPPLPIGVSTLVIAMAVEPRIDAPHAVGEVFWAAGDRPFGPDHHHRLFALVPDGEVHEYSLALPLADPSELEAQALRVRVDPVVFPARVSVHRVDWR